MQAQQPIEVTTEMLMKIGDHLMSLQSLNPNVKDSVGFNYYDMNQWPTIRGNLSKMIYVLQKYQKQIKDLGYSLNFKEIPQMESQVVFTLYHESIAINLVGARLDRQTFNSYLKILFRYHFKYFHADAVNYIQPPFFYELKQRWKEFQSDMLEIGITVFEMPKKIAESKEYTEAFKVRDQILYKHKVKKIALIKEGQFFCFYCPYSPVFNDIFSNKKGTITGISEYCPKTHARKVVSIELVKEALAKIEVLMPDYEVFTDGYDEALKDYEKMQDELSKPNPLVNQYLSPEYVLRAYQNRGVNFFFDNDGCAILGDKMGLGKTLQLLAYVAATGGKLLVVCPLVVRIQWLEEAVKFFPKYFKGYTLEMRAEKLIGNLVNPKIGTITYGSFKKYKNVILKMGFTIIALDESHLIKNGKAQRTKEILSVRDYFTGRVCLSGTSVENKKAEFFNQVEFVRPGLVTLKELQKGTIGGVWNKLVSSIYLSRTKAEVLKDLPEKTTTILKLQIDGMPERPNNIGESSKARVVAALAKSEETINFIKDSLINTDEKIIVFSESKDAVLKIHGAFPKESIIHHGDLSPNVREQAKKDFYDKDNKRIFVTTRQSMSVGANLVAGSIIIFNDLPWKATDIQQAEDRAHRFGQKRNVNVYWMIAENSNWDNRLCEIIRIKYELCKKMNDGKQLTKQEIEWLNTPVSIDDLVQGEK